MNLKWFNPQYFDQDEFKNMILLPDTCHFYWVFVMVLVIGFYGLMLSLALAKKMANIDVAAKKRVSNDMEL